MGRGDAGSKKKRVIMGLFEILRVKLEICKAP